MALMKGTTKILKYRGEIFDLSQKENKKEDFGPSFFSNRRA
jgi:hypothetical protein